MQLVKSHRLLDLGNGPAGVQPLGTSVGTVHDSVTSVQRHRVLQHVLSHLGGLVTRVDDPAVSLHQNSGPKVLGLVPPVRGTRSGATGTQNAFVQPIQLSTVSNQLQILTTVSRVVLALQPRLDRLVLLVEVSQVGNQVTNDIHVGQGVDLQVAVASLSNLAQASQGVAATNVHGTRTTDTLTAQTSKGKSGVLLVLDLKKGVQHHGTTLVQVNFVSLQLSLNLGSVGVPPVDLELLDVSLSLSRSGKASESLSTKHSSKHHGVC